MSSLIARWLYSLALRLLTPVYLARLWWRGRAEPVYRKRIGERLGYYAQKPRRGKGGVVWVHAVSLGETRAAAPLIEALRREFPSMRMLLTCSTATGVQAGLDLLKPQDDQAWFPYDTPGAVRRFLKRYRPAVGVIMETEIWPNMMAEAQQRQIPMVLANARLSVKSQRKGRRFAVLLVPALLAFTRILAQTSRDAQRLREMGARMVEVCGNTKFDITPPAKLMARGLEWRQSLTRSVVLMASSREGEEEGLFEAWRGLREPRPLLVVVPRHPQRFDDVAATAARAGFIVARRSQWHDKPSADQGTADVWIGDSMGEMPLYYAMSDVALLGGSFAPLGGQNLIEAAACGCPLLMGMHTFNFEEAAQMAIESGAAARMKDIGSAVRRAAALVDDPRRNEWVEQALGFAGAHRGANERMAQRIAMLMTGLDSVR
ncbi:MAG: 3-deoxy-D-manno-octulosonic acid transferase [Aquincola sp.]|nr:3-deoxy-D-manno-octulosonic acid transferase [Aquincola sp.]MDH5331646.1 3-deoxy-D-manno-octulosonic acid transferase [Aquincola sp.]